MSGSNTVQLVATVVVAGATIWYAYLTHKLLRHSENQFKHLLVGERALRREKMLALRSKCERLLGTIKTFPNPLVWEKLKLAALWNSEDLVGFEVLAASIGAAEAHSAGVIVQNLRWFEDRYKNAKEGVWPQEDITGDRIADRWQSNLVSITASLARLKDACIDQLPAMDRFG